MTSTHVHMPHSAVTNYLRDRLQHLHASGQGYAMACCPFHADHSPSLSVTLRNGSYRCFGCGARGDLAQLIARLEGLSLPKAIAKARQLRGEMRHG